MQEINNTEIAAVPDFEDISHNDPDGPRAELRFTPAESEKFLAFIAFCRKVASETFKAETDAMQGLGTLWTQPRLDFWRSVLSACNWMESIVGLLTKGD